MPYYFQSLVKDWVILATSIGFFAWIIYLTVGLVRRRQQSIMQKHLLDKFASAQDFAEFIQTPAGQKYVMGFTDTVTSPRNSILSSIRIGFVLMFLGVGSLVASDGIPGIFLTIGWLGLSLGIGFLVSAGVSHFVAKKAGWKVQE
jgi:hypothetical protein